MGETYLCQCEDSTPPLVQTNIVLQVSPSKEAPVFFQAFLHHLIVSSTNEMTLKTFLKGNYPRLVADGKATK